MEGLDELCCELRGNVLTPDEGAAFEAALEEWAASLSPSDVVAAVKWAVKRGLSVAAKCGGHGGGIATKIKLRLHDASSAVSGIGCPALCAGGVFPNPAIGVNVTRAIRPKLDPVIISISMVVVVDDGTKEEKAALIKPLRGLGPDTVGQNTWRQTQSTHGPAIAGLQAAFPVHYEKWCGGHIAAEVRRMVVRPVGWRCASSNPVLLPITNRQHIAYFWQFTDALVED
eukprot:scaffold2.g6832.t1